MVPDIRFNSDCNEWQNDKLEKHIITHSERNIEGNDNVLSVSNTKGFIHQSEQFDNHIVASSNTSNYKIVQPGWFAYNPARINIGSIAKLNLNEAGIVSPMYEVFECNADTLDSNYLAQLYKDSRFNHWVVQQIQGTVRQCLKMEDMKVMPISLPQIKEQKKISALLSDIDLKIENQKKKVNKLKEFKQAMLVKMFPQEGQVIPEIRFKDDDGNEYPEWNFCLLRDITTKITVGIANSSTHAYRDNGVVLLRNTNIKENFLDDSDIVYIDKEFAALYSTKKLQKNDLLVCRTGYVGRTCVVPEKYVDAQTFTTLIVRIKQEYYPIFISIYMNSHLGKEYFDSVKIGGSQQNIGAGILEKMPLLIPCYDEQIKIAQCLCKFESKIELETIYLEKLLDIKNALLYKLLPVRS